MTNEQLIAKIKAIIKDDDIRRYTVHVDNSNYVTVWRCDLSNPRGLLIQTEELCALPDMTEELDLRPYMRMFQVTETKGGDVWKYFSVRSKVYKTGPWICMHREIEIV